MHLEIDFSNDQDKSNDRHDNAHYDHGNVDDELHQIHGSSAFERQMTSGREDEERWGCSYCPVEGKHRGEEVAQTHGQRGVQQGNANTYNVALPSGNLIKSCS